MIRYLPLDDISASFSPALEEAVTRTVRSGWYLHGKETEAFEREFASYVGANCCVGVANGLDALTLALLAMKSKYGWPDGDEVIVPDMTFVATALSVVRAGLTPRLADVGSDALLTVQAAEQALTPRVRAVVPVHLYGHCAPMKSLCAWAKSHGLKILEDAAQAHGAATDGKKAGAWGEMAAFSFYPGKNLGALGDGGAVTTSDRELARLVRIFANYGSSGKYRHTEMGLNSRLDEVQAAALRVKLPRLDADNKRRRELAALYNSMITGSSVLKPYGGDTTESIFHIYPLRCERRDELQRHLAGKGVETLIHYPLPISAQPAFTKTAATQCPLTPWSRKWAETELSLPLHPLLTDGDARKICEAVNSF